MSTDQAEMYVLVDQTTGKSFSVREASDELIRRVLAEVEQACEANRKSVEQVSMVNANNYATLGLLKYELDRRTRTLVLASALDLEKLRRQQN